MLRFPLGFLIIILGGATGFASYVMDRVEQKLRGKGFKWSTRVIDFPGVVWNELSGPGVIAKELRVEPSWPLQVVLRDATIDPSAIGRKKQGMASTQDPLNVQSSIDIPFEVRASNLSVKWGEKKLLEQLTGSLYPTISLAGEEDTIEAIWDPANPTNLQGSARTRISFAHARADIAATFNLGSYLDLQIASDNVVLQHSFLSQESIPDIPLNMRLVWKPDTDEVAAEGTVGELNWSAVGTTDITTHNLQFRVPITPLSTIVSIFGSMIPEAENATIAGEVGLAAHITGPPWDWSFEPAAQALAVSNALPSDFGGERIRWKRNEVPYETGPGTADWVALDDAGWLPEAAIAAEDIRFRAHPGFDLVAIQEALDASVQEERIRGGSTITQQLAKNLFLDGRRTLLRKMRELILALDMEERMTKDAILALYLNVVEFGPGIHGIGAAADAWFLKDPANLSPREAAFLASILPAPNMWHQRISETKRVPIQRVNEVLNRMRIRGSLSRAEHKRAIQERLRVVPP